MKWNFGDGGIGYGKTPTHTYALRGNYVVTLTATDAQTGSMNRSFTVVNVSNLGAFKSVGQTAGFLVGPYPLLYNTPAGYPSTVQVNRPVVVVKAGVSLDFCSWAYDFSSVDAQNLTFEWHFSNTSNPYTPGGPLSLAPRIATAQCEPQPYGYYSGQVLVLNPEFTTVSHTFTCPGWYNVTVSVIDAQGIRHSTPLSQVLGGSWVRNTIEVQVVNLTAPPQSQIPKYRVPVGQVALLNASNTLGIPPTSAFYNYTWNAGKLGTTWGDVGRDTSFRVVNQKVSMTTQVNSTAIPCCNPNPVNLATWTNFTDVRPTVGIDSFYATASMTVTVQNPYYYNYLNFTLFENGQNQGWYNLSYPSSSVSFYPINFQMSDNWGIQLKYTPYGQSGGTYVNVAFNWANDNSYIDNYDYTESDYSSDTASVWFSNANTTSQNTVPISVNYEALGEPFTTYVVFFSPAQTNLTETWTMGDGTVYHTSDAAPSSPGPTMSTWYLQYAYYTGANYIFNVTACDDYNYCSGDQITVSNTRTFAANDTAPSVSLQNSAGNSPKGLPGVQASFKATVTNQDNTTGSAMVNWQYGDGLTSMNFTRNTAGGIVYGVHAYRYSWSKYLVVVYATSKNGSTSANYTFVNVADPPPIASFTTTPSSVVVGAPVTFNGANSEAGALGALGLSFGWLFGDGNSAGGQGVPAEVATNTYSATGIYAARLTVENDEGGYAYAKQTITVSNPPIASPFPYVTNQTNVTADVSSWYSLHVPAGSNFANIPVLNATWYWGDGGYNSYGRSTVHTFLFPGNYNISVTVTAQYMGVYWAHALVHVQDGVPTVAVGFQFGESYGEVHPTNFTAIALGDYADQGKAWHFTWAWGDSSSWFNATGTLTDSVVHTYSLAGSLSLSVNVSGPYPNVVYPWAKLGAPNATTTVQVLSVPNVDGDGVPDALAASQQVSITTAGPNIPTGQEWGAYSVNGVSEACTWYVGANCASIPGIGSFSASSSGCGMTNIEQILGTVTGFPSDPLECSQAGDGVSNVGHFITSVYSAPTQVAFTAANSSVQTIANESIPNVAYAGPGVGFNQSTLTVQLNTTALGQVAVYLYAPGVGSILLGTPTVATTTFTLVQSNPVLGASSRYGISVGDLAPGGTWAVGAVVTSSSPVSPVQGTISAATLRVAYYTNPALADPTHQGMLTQSTLSVPVFNCSESTTVSFTQFNPATYTVTTVNYYPYTQSYYKLSVLQGVPYVPTTRVSNWLWNSNSTCPSSMPVSAMPTEAVYLGDADFGIAPWNAHAAGDNALTNGMKALGATVYMTTRGQYMNSNGQMCQVGPSCAGPSNYAGYPADPLVGSSNPDALLPLNPTALSTAGDGIPDSQALDPVNPVGLEVTISSATDPYCYILAGTFYTPQDIAEVTLVTASGQNEPTMYTPFKSAGGGQGCDPVLGVNAGEYNFNFNFGASYFFPVSDVAGTYVFNLALWQNQTLTASSPRATGQTSITLTQSCNVGCTTASLPNGFTGSISVVTIPRAPVIFVNRTGEVANLPGFGYRYEGEQEFDTFAVTVGSNAVAPFSFSSVTGRGIDIVIVPRSDILSSNFESVLTSGTVSSGPQDVSNLIGALGTGCSIVGGMTAATRSPQISSDGSVDTTWTVDLTSAPSCAPSLLYQLMPFNGQGSTYFAGYEGQFISLSGYQLELLGLTNQSLQLDPFVVPSSYSSPSGTPPTNILPATTTSPLGVLTSIHGSSVAYSNFCWCLPPVVTQFGQNLWGGITGIGSAIWAGITGAAAVFGGWLGWAINQAVQILTAAYNIIKAAAAAYDSGMYGSSNNMMAAYAYTFSSSNQGPITTAWQDTLPFYLSVIGLSSLSTTLTQALQEAFQVLSPFESLSNPQNIVPLMNALGLSPNGFNLAQIQAYFSALPGAFFAQSMYASVNGYAGLLGLQNKAISYPSGSSFPSETDETSFVSANNNIAGNGVSANFLYGSILGSGTSTTPTVSEILRLGAATGVGIFAALELWATYAQYQQYLAALTELDETALNPDKVLGTVADLQTNIANAGLGLTIAGIGLTAEIITALFESSHSTHSAEVEVSGLTMIMAIAGAAAAIIGSGSVYVVIAALVMLLIAAVGFAIVLTNA